ncbi:hypothetical protein KJ853_04205 [Patescibacteria group bacterium]|nr:hypothetical protein [Patescibacteria group bacterium]
MGVLILRGWEAIVKIFEKNNIWVMLFVCIFAAITSFFYACLTKGTLLLFTIFLPSSILAYEAWIVIRRRRKAQKKLTLSEPCPSISPARPFVLDLRICKEGMSCDEYSTLIIAGLDSEDIPPTVRSQMNQHENACSYHQSTTWHQSALGTPVTETLEKAAMEIVKKYSQE